MAVCEVRDATAEVEGDTLVFVDGLHEAAQVGAQDLGQRRGLGRDDVHVQGALDQGGGDLQPDEAGADHHHAAAGIGRLNNGLAIPQAAQDMDIGVVEPKKRGPRRLCASGQDHGVKRLTRAIYEDHLAGAQVEFADLGACSQIDVAGFVEGGVAQRHPVPRRLAGQVILGTVGPIIRRVRVGAQQGQVAVEAFASQHLCCGEARRAAADDDDAPRTILRLRPLCGRTRLEFFRYEDRAFALLHPPAVDGINRRRADRLAGLQAELRMMPRASHGLAHQQAFAERAVIMGAKGADRPQLAAHSGDHDRLAAHMADQHGALRDIGCGNAG